MSRKHAELEREFIDDLEPRTGRSLSAWMQAIDASGLEARNAIIDWLRPQGLTFAHASWLERIHNNGGRPIYNDAGGAAAAPVTAPVADGPAVVQPRAASPAPPPRPMPAPADVPLPSARAVPPKVAAVAPAPATKAPAPAATTAPVAVADLLARGKGLKPLADLLIREICQALPGTSVTASGELLSFCRPGELAVLLVGPRELKLGLDLGDWPFESGVQRARLPGTGARITHMLVVNDARQISEALLALARQSDGRVNGVG